MPKLLPLLRPSKAVCTQHIWVGRTEFLYLRDIQRIVLQTMLVAGVLNRASWQIHCDHAGFVPAEHNLTVYYIPSARKVGAKVYTLDSAVA